MTTSRKRLEPPSAATELVAAGLRYVEEKTSKETAEKLAASLRDCETADVRARAIAGAIFDGLAYGNWV